MNNRGNPSFPLFPLIPIFLTLDDYDYLYWLSTRYRLYRYFYEIIEPLIIAFRKDLIVLQHMSRN